jgi:hypothetical protein
MVRALMSTTLKLVSVSLLLAGLAFGQDAGTPAAPPAPPPAADEIKRVLDYYYNGKDRGPALVELKACLKVDSMGKDPVMKNECLEPVTGTVKKDTTVHGWTYWYLPEGANYDNVSIQFVYGDEVRSTTDIKLNSVGRTRTWRSATVTKKGKWTIRVKDGAKELGSTSFTVE